MKIDAMGGDNAPQSNILGAKTFLDSNKNTSLILVGDKTIINDQLKEHNLSDHSKIDIHHASEVVTMNEKNPSKAFKSKPDNSIVQSVMLVKEGKADAVLAASIFHFGEYSITEAKNHMRHKKIEVR